MYGTKLPTWVLLVVLIAGTSILPWLSVGAAHPAAGDARTDIDQLGSTVATETLVDEATDGIGAERPSSLSIDGLHADSLEDHVVRSLQQFDLPIGVLLAGYSRYDDSDPLENDARQQIYEAVERSPGTYPTELAETTRIPRSTVRYHVRILEEEGLISAEKIRGKQRFFPREGVDAELSAALGDDATRAVLTAVERLEPVTVSQLADDLDRAPSTVSYHLGRLTDAGLVEQEREYEHGAVLNRLAAETRLELRQHPDSGDVTDPDSLARSSGPSG